MDNKNQTQETKENSESKPKKDTLNLNKVLDIAQSLANTPTGQKIKKEGLDIATGLATQLITKKSLTGLKGVAIAQVAELAIKHSATVVKEGKKWLNEVTTDESYKNDFFELIKTITTDEKYKSNSFALDVASFLTINNSNKQLTDKQFKNWIAIIDSVTVLQQNDMEKSDVMQSASKMVKNKISEEAQTMFNKHFKIKLEAAPVSKIKEKIVKKRVSQPVDDEPSVAVKTRKTTKK